MDSPFSLALVGGAGPLVSARLQCELLAAYQRATGARLDADFPALLSLNRAVAGVGPHGVDNGDQASVDLVVLGRQARACGARLAIAPCASLSRLLPSDGEGLKWVHWVDRAARRLAERGSARVGVIGSRSAQRDGVFKTPLEQAGLEVVNLPPVLQDDADALIWEGMLGRVPESCCARLERCHTYFLSQGCDAVWWGCTELAFLPQQWLPSLPCITPMEAMVSAVMEHWLPHQSPEALCESVVADMLIPSL